MEFILDSNLFPGQSYRSRHLPPRLPIPFLRLELTAAFPKLGDHSQTSIPIPCKTQASSNEKTAKVKSTIWAPSNLFFLFMGLWLYFCFYWFMTPWQRSFCTMRTEISNVTLLHSLVLCFPLTVGWGIVWLQRELLGRQISQARIRKAPL